MENENESVSFFQILGPNNTALENNGKDPLHDGCENMGSISDCGPTFTTNEFKHNQFWFLDIAPGSDYGIIGPKHENPKKTALILQGV